MPIVTHDEAIQEILAQARQIAVVGLSPDPERPSHEVAKAMQEAGYGIIPVNPKVDAVLGRKSEDDLLSVSGPVSIVDVFRDSVHVPEIVEACIEKGVPTLWLQEGVIHEAAANQAARHGINVIMDRCLYKEYRRLLG